MFRWLQYYYVMTKTWHLEKIVDKTIRISGIWEFSELPIVLQVWVYRETLSERNALKSYVRIGFFGTRTSNKDIESIVSKQYSVH